MPNAEEQIDVSIAGEGSSIVLMEFPHGGMMPDGAPRAGLIMESRTYILLLYPKSIRISMSVADSMTEE